MKQTAVECLVNELIKNGHNFKLYKKEIEQAKEMEKQQIIDAWIDGKENKEFGNTVFEDAEQYYSEKFKQ